MLIAMRDLRFQTSTSLHTPKDANRSANSAQAASDLPPILDEVRALSEESRVLPCAKVAQICNVTGRTVRNWLAAGRLAGIQRNGRLYVLCHSLEEFLRHDR